jgi:hypothetical protein
VGKASLWSSFGRHGNRAVPEWGKERDDSGEKREMTVEKRER